jgi:mannose-6-phosphate isomerase-like protein (cupin superfamily)
VTQRAEFKFPSLWLHLTISSTFSGSRIPLNARQKGFRPIDGCAENVWMVQHIIERSKRERRPTYMVFMDVAKAFDSVSHQTLILACTSTTFAKSSQDNTLIFIIHEGCLEIKIGTNSKFTVMKGDTFFVPSQTSYTINNKGVDVAEMFVTQYSLNPEEEQREIIAPKN